MKQLIVKNVIPLNEFLNNSKNKSKSEITFKCNHFVDLDLPSGTLWCKCNIGSKKEYEPGYVFQWGGLEPMNDENCSWSNAPFNNWKENLEDDFLKKITNKIKSKSKKYFNKYEQKFNKEYFDEIKDKVCPNGILSKEYDIAYQTYKGKAHIPTDKEIEELIKNTKQEWIILKQHHIYVCKFTSKKDDSKYIIIPDCCYRHYTSWESGSDDGEEDENGYIIHCDYGQIHIWSSTCSHDYNYAKHMGNWCSKPAIGSMKRFNGLYIRPVKN